MAIYLNFLEASCLVSLNQIIFCHVLPENVHTPHIRDKKFQGEGVSASAGGQGGGSWSITEKGYWKIYHLKGPLSLIDYSNPY